MTMRSAIAPSTIIVGMALITVAMILLPSDPAAVAGSSACSSWCDAFANAGVFVLLAMGLNVVVGLAGLLDLGYAAFFAIGAYTYAYSQLPVLGLDLPFLPMLASVPRSRPSSASPSARPPSASAATTWRS